MTQIKMGENTLTLLMDEYYFIAFKSQLVVYETLYEYFKMEDKNKLKCI